MPAKRTPSKWTLLAMLALLLLRAAPAADAATLTVTLFTDTNAGGPAGTGTGNPGDLRAAILGSAAGDTIQFGCASPPCTIMLGGPLPPITHNLTIDGGLFGNVAIDGSNAYRVFFVDSGNVTIENLRIQNALARGGAGGQGLMAGGGGAGLGAGLFVNQAGASVSLVNDAFLNMAVQGGAGGLGLQNIGSGVGGGGGGGLGFNGGNGSNSTNLAGAAGGGGASGAGATFSGINGGNGGAGGGGGGGTATGTNGTGGSAYAGNDPGQSGNGSGGNGGFGGGGGGGGNGAFGGAGGFGGGGGGSGNLSVGSGTGGAGGGGGAATFGGSLGAGVSGGSGGSNGLAQASGGGGGGAAAGPAVFVAFGSVTTSNSGATGMIATGGAGGGSNGAGGATAGSAGGSNAVPLFNYGGTVNGASTTGPIAAALPDTDPMFAVSVALAGTGTGSVTSSPSGIACGNTCTAGFVSGTQVTLTATPSGGSTFAGWSGACSGTSTCVVTTTQARSVTATFTLIPTFLLTVNRSGTGGGTVTSGDGMINCGATCTATYQQGAQVTLTAAPNGNSTFAGWSGACSGTAACVVTMNAAQSVTASFTEITYPLDVAEAGTGSGIVISSPSGINCSATSNQCSAIFNSGSMVTLTASAAAGSSFAGWSGAGCSGTGTCTVTMSGAQAVIASFALNPTNTLLIAKTGTGAGTVTSAPAGINCGSTCAASFAAGAQVTLTAAIGANSTFTGWSGGGCGGTGNCVVTLNANTTVTASFVANSTATVILLASILPDSRSLQVGKPGSVFATILNIGTVSGGSCTIAPVTSVPANFIYQTTNPATNAATGTPNTPATVPAGGGQTFVLGFIPTAAFSPTDIAFSYNCANAPNPAQTVLGLNTLKLSASTAPVPDIIAVNATADPGYVDVSPTNPGAFAVATTNLGAPTAITVSADTGAANLPLTLAVCQTNPATGACLAAAAPSVALPVNSGDTGTFGIFAAAASAIPDMPAINRVFVRFVDNSGVLRGETSVAVRTQ